MLGSGAGLGAREPSWALNEGAFALLAGEADHFREVALSEAIRMAATQSTGACQSSRARPRSSLRWRACTHDRAAGPFNAERTDEAHMPEDSISLPSFNCHPRCFKERLRRLSHCIVNALE